MADAITIKALQDASLDAKSLEEVVNGNEVKQVTTRKGETYPSVKKAIKTLFENGGLPATPFATNALMTASALVDGKYAQVTDDSDASNNGLYVKTAGAWVKSGYDPTALANTYTDNKVSELFVTSYNLFNSATAKIDTTVSGEDGQDAPQTGWYASEYIKVMPNTTYTLTASEGVSAFRNIAFYKEDKSFINRTLLANVDWSLPYTVSTKSDTYYISVTTSSDAAVGNRMIYKGTDVKAYLPYIASYPKNITIDGTAKLAVEEIARNEAVKVNSN